MKARILIVGLGAAVAAVLVVLLGQLGFPAPFVVAWIIVVLAIILAFRQDFTEVGADWPPEKPSDDARSSDVSRMAWAINARTGVAGHVVVRRVQALLRRRLAHSGLDLDDPAQHTRIDALLGEGVRDSLHRREVHRTDIERVLDAIDRIPNDPEDNG
ncbi:hypothetical protein [Microbacterium oxydans]|uniref:hypothetical protein n=1 Tax=Microbacterium oxydans TaxID=82380 RepID=UPI00226B8BAA|nr:hypothetical protein [Microbacterium oxydans]WAA64747.1 hypothetical protein MME74_10860 [Microbacterium oxydans]